MVVTVLSGPPRLWWGLNVFHTQFLCWLLRWENATRGAKPLRQPLFWNCLVIYNVRVYYCSMHSCVSQLVWVSARIPFPACSRGGWCNSIWVVTKKILLRLQLFTEMWTSDMAACGGIMSLEVPHHPFSGDSDQLSKVWELKKSQTTVWLNDDVIR